MTWYLIMANMYIGPFTEEKCTKAAEYLSVLCSKAEYLTACPVDANKGIYTTCPKFNHPQVTIK